MKYLLSLVVLIAGCAPAMACPFGDCMEFDGGYKENSFRMFPTTDNAIMGDPVTIPQPLTVEWHCIETEKWRLFSNFAVDDDENCLKEIGFRSDGMSVWRRPPQDLKDAAEREQRSKPYK